MLELDTKILFLSDYSFLFIRKLRLPTCVVWSPPHVFHWVPTLLRLAVLQPVMPIINIFTWRPISSKQGLFWGASCVQDHMSSNGQRQKHLLNQTDHSQNLSPFVVFGLPEHCTNFQFPPPPSVLRHRRVISTFLDNLMVYTMKTICFLNSYH